MITRHTNQALMLTFLSVIMMLGSISAEDNFDLIKAKIEEINSNNCAMKSRHELFLPSDVISQIPVYHTLTSQAIHVNRSIMVYVQNLALSRSLFFSFIYAKLQAAGQFMNQPGLLYFYLTTSSAVTASPDSIIGSGIFFDNNVTYANWYKTLHFNRTLSLFGPRSWRQNTDVKTEDYSVANYTSPSFKLNPWYNQWMPDTMSSNMFPKHIFSVSIEDSRPGHRDQVSFFGPTLPSRYGRYTQPVIFTQPYFDCGRSNKWIVSATSPVVDYLARYTYWVNVRRARNVAVSTADLGFENIDFNPCPLSRGNPAPNYFAGIAKCKPTTICQPVSGFGFARGGYQCVCKPGFQYPPGQTSPFRGVDIERATELEYSSGFDCLEQNVPTPDKKRSPAFEKLPFTNLGSNRRDSLSRRQGPNDQYQRVTKHNCKSKGASELVLPSNAINPNQQFESQGRMGLRLAHFLSSFLQYPSPVFGRTHIREDRPLSRYQMFGETIANVMGDLKILGSGIYFDRGAFVEDNTTTDRFGPNAWQVYDSGVVQGLDQSTVLARDFGELGTDYLTEEWFIIAKNKWRNVNNLSTFSTKQVGLTERTNRHLSEFMPYPFTYRAPDFHDGDWLQPRFKCDDRIMNWVETYVVPFFGLDNSRSTVQFKGVVTIDVYISSSDIQLQVT